MAKVVLVLEDVKEADGSDGLIIDWQSGDKDFDESSIAHSYAQAFIEHIMNQAKTAEILDKNTATVQLDKSEKDPNLN